MLRPHAGRSLAGLCEMRQGMNLFPDQNEVLAVAFSPDDQTIATGSYEGQTRLWDLRTRRVFGALLKHAGDVVSVAFTDDGRQIFTAGLHKTVRLWQITAPMEGTAEQINLLSQVTTGPGAGQRRQFPPVGRQEAPGSA